jgi:carboxypeptidase C (cathepsin A)
MNRKWKKWMAILVLLLSWLAFTPAGPFEAAEKESKASENVKKEAAATPPRERVSKTEHRLTLDGKEWDYAAVAGEITVGRKEEEAEGRIFYVAYTVNDGEKSRRPITFAFNGGPGAASVWLHMGSLGPKRIKLGKDGRPLPPPVQYADNPYTWLQFTDLVFIDPVGTGFSRSIPNDEKTRRKFYGVQQDIESVAEFIRLYLSRNGRWDSPKFLAGESYGTTRGAGLAWHLHQRHGIDLNGILLISPVLDYDTILFHPSNDLPYMLFLPTYAAAAWRHQMLPDSLQQKGLDTLLTEVEQFSIERYATFLAKGENLDHREKEELIEKLSAYTGLAKDFIEQCRYRISWSDFTMNLLKKRGLLLGRMDSTITGIVPDPANPYPRYDPSLEPLFGPFSSAINAYLREGLKFESDQVYEFLNNEVNRSWDWVSGMARRQGYLDVSHSLRDALAINRRLKVFIASGFYDLATPYFTVAYTLNHMWLGDKVSNVTVRRYQGGHMIYTHNEALERLFQDARDFYVGALNQ